MSQITHCDGCGEVCESPTARGLQRKLDYCENCIPIVDDRADQMDTLHDRIAEQWRDGIAAIDQEALEKCPKMKFSL